MSQIFVMDNKTKIEDVVAAAGKDAGATVTLAAYVRFQLGAGIEKQESDFAAEVAAAAGTRQPEPVAYLYLSPPDCGGRASRGAVDRPLPSTGPSRAREGTAWHRRRRHTRPA